MWQHMSTAANNLLAQDGEICDYLTYWKMMENNLFTPHRIFISYKNVYKIYI